MKFFAFLSVAVFLSLPTLNAIKLKHITKDVKRDEESKNVLKENEET